MKDKLCEINKTDVLGLRQKTYSYFTHDGGRDNKLKEVNM